jgi:uncharacterized protein YkwD
MALAATAVLSMTLSGAPAAGREDKSSRLLELVNTARAESGLMGLTLEPRLTMAACRHAQDLARGGPLSHRGRDGSDIGDRVLRSGYDFAMAAENLAAGVPTPDETVWLWLGSPGHRRNILTADFHHAGIANLATGDVWVLVLGAVRTGRAPGGPADDRPAQPSVNGC